jgi:type I restriction enzyme, S subunit
MVSSTMRKVKLKEVCDRITVGHVGPMADKYTPEGIPFIRSQNITPFRLNVENIKYVPREFHEKLSKSALRAGDVAVVRTGYPGTACVIPDMFTELNCADLVVITPSAELNPYYLAAVFNSAWGMASVAGNLVGVAQQHFNIGAAKELEVDLPPRATQDRIAGILSAYDELIENSQRRIKILEAMARGLYREWFVHFRFPGHDNHPLIASPLGVIPQGWEAGRLDDVLVLQRGFDLPKASRVEGTVPIYAATGITGFHNIAKVTAPGVVTGRSGTIGEVVYVQEDFWPLNTALWVKEFPKAEPLYAYFVLSALDLAQFNSGAAVPTLNRNDIHGLVTLIPPRPLQIRFQDIVGVMFSRICTLELQIQNLRNARNLLLPRLLSGQLDLTTEAA